MSDKPLRDAVVILTDHVADGEGESRFAVAERRDVLVVVAKGNYRSELSGLVVAWGGIPDSVPAEAKV